MLFTIHKHDADKAGLHYDIRLQSPNDDNIVWSFVCKKEIPLKKNLKRLVIKQKNHNRQILNYSGKIDEGYGKGILTIWDSGNYTIVNKTRNSIELNFNGNKIKGIYYLVRYKNKNNYLFFKK